MSANPGGGDYVRDLDRLAVVMCGADCEANCRHEWNAAHPDDPVTEQEQRAWEERMAAKVREDDAGGMENHHTKETFEDELDAHIAESFQDPEYRAAVEAKVEHWQDRAIAAEEDAARLSERCASLSALLAQVGRAPSDLARAVQAEAQVERLSALLAERDSLRNRLDTRE